MSGVSPEPGALEVALACYAAAMPLDKGVDLEDLAARFGCSVEDIKRAMQVVAEAEDEDLCPISNAEIKGGQLIKRQPAGFEKYLRPRVRLSPTQVRAALLALDLISGDVDSGMLRGLKSKLYAASGGEPDSGFEVELGRGFDEDIPISDAVERARREKRAMEIRYFSRKRAQARLVEPLEVSSRDGFEYLIAYCRSTEIVRPFQMDRILSASITDERFTERRDEDSRSEIPPRRAVVRFSPEASPSPEDGLDLDLIEERADGSTDYALYYTDTGEAARAVTQYLGEAVVLEPEELRREVRHRAESMLLAYRGYRG